MRERAKLRESCVELGHMLVFHVVMVYPSTIMNHGTMGYPLCDSLDADDIAGPHVSVYDRTRRPKRILGSLKAICWFFKWLLSTIAQSYLKEP